MQRRFNASHSLLFYLEINGDEFISACSATPTGCDKGGWQPIDGVGIDTYFGSVNLLDIRRCEYVGWRAFSINSPAIEHDHPIVLDSSASIQVDNGLFDTVG